MNAGLAQGRNGPLAPLRFFCLILKGAICLLLLVLGKLVKIVFIRLGPIRPPGLGDARGLLHRDAMPPLREGCEETRSTKTIRHLVATKQGDVLLSQRKIHLGKRVQGGQLPLIGSF